MPTPTRPRSNWADPLAEVFFRVAASGWLPRRLFLREPPSLKLLQARSGHLQLEIVSHCWNYSRLLAYQLSSLVLHPVRKISVQITVYYNDEDQRTSEVLDFFGQQSVPNVRWNWVRLEKPLLLRRSIGRNRAALATTADWIWFSDCDQVFHGGFLDHLADQLQGRKDALLFPRIVHCSPFQEENDRLLRTAAGKPAIVDIDPSNFVPIAHSRAVGALQIAHGDVARKVGYCNAIPFYQKPADRWRKTYEDRVFRWLLGTQGKPLDAPGLYRIEHRKKGRDDGRPQNPLVGWVTGWLRVWRRWKTEYRTNI